MNTQHQASTTAGGELKGGRRARQAAMLCQDEGFRLWLDRRARAKYNMLIDDGTHTPEDARDFILKACAVASRAELDHNPDAAKRFNQIQYHYNRYLRRFQQP